jgi:hypothetical protein
MPAADITDAHAAYSQLHAQVAGYRCTRAELAARLLSADPETLGTWFGLAMSWAMRWRPAKRDDPAAAAGHAALATSLAAELECRTAGPAPGPAALPVIRFCGSCGGYIRCGHEPPVTGPAGTGLPGTLQVLWTPAHPHPRDRAPRGGDPSRAEQAAILAALSLATQDSLAVETDKAGDLIVLATAEEAGDDEAGTWIVGLALHDPQDGWYLGCVTCKGQIEESDAGMCLPCRQDAAIADAEQQAAADAGW